MPEHNNITELDFNKAKDIPCIHNFLCICADSLNRGRFDDQGINRETLKKAKKSDKFPILYTVKSEDIYDKGKKGQKNLEKYYRGIEFDKVYKINITKRQWLRIIIKVEDMLRSRKVMRQQKVLN